jgi:hypothetical protein
MNIEPIPSVSKSHRIRRIVSNLAIAVIATISIAACSPGASDKPTAAETSEPTVSTTASPSSSPEATATVGPGRGTAFFSVQPDPVPVTFTMPAGWEVSDDLSYVTRSGADPDFGVVFIDVANIYVDGCRWVLVDPPPGPSVDDLVAAYASVPGSGAAEDVTVGGFKGKQIQYTIPDYSDDECKEGRFALFQEDGRVRGDFPSLSTGNASKDQHKVLILDVDGTRLVILAIYPRNISAQDRTDLDGILSSIEIG